MWATSGPACAPRHRDPVCSQASVNHREAAECRLRPADDDKQMMTKQMMTNWTSATVCRGLKDIMQSIDSRSGWSLAADAGASMTRGHSLGCSRCTLGPPRQALLALLLCSWNLVSTSLKGVANRVPCQHEKKVTVNVVRGVR